MLRYKSLSARVRPWSGSDSRAFLIISGGHGAQSHVPTPDILESWLHTIASWGYSVVRTNALGPLLAGAFTDIGFCVAQRLTLLEAHLTDSHPRTTTITEPSPHIGSVSGSAALVSLMLHGEPSRELITLDEAAFPREWALDRSSLRDALRATPRSRLFRHGGPTSPIGFLLVGIGGSTGYIQRLAVHPDHQRQGVGRRLMEQGLQWSRRAGASRSVVNTEWDNGPALGLYQSMGFVPLAHGLVVVERALP